MRSNQKALVNVWDLPTRVFHWGLVILFLSLVVTGEVGGQFMRYHILSGYLLSGFIIFRILWGIVGSHHARFMSFVRSPKAALMYLLDLAQGKAGFYMGHNPAGAMMVLILLAALSLQVLTGLVTSDDVLWSGPFYNSVSEMISDWGATIHHMLEVILKLLVVIHILSVILHQFYFKDPLIGAMIHGYKPLSYDFQGKNTKHHFALMFSMFVSVAWVVWLWSLPL